MSYATHDITRLRGAVTEVPFLHSYVGSKRKFLGFLKDICEDRPIVELFAGSGIITGTYGAPGSMLVDYNPDVARALSRFDQLIVPEVFTRDEFMEFRWSSDWWRYAYCIGHAALNGFWRSSKNGFNIVGRYKRAEYRVRPQYEAALERWRELKLDVRNCSYADITDDDIAALGPNVLVVLDPPYENTVDTYSKDFDFEAYWERVASLRGRFDLLIFDTDENLTAHGFEPTLVMPMKAGSTKSDGFVYLPKRVEADDVLDEVLDSEDLRLVFEQPGESRWEVNFASDGDSFIERFALDPLLAPTLALQAFTQDTEMDDERLYRWLDEASTPMLIPKTPVGLRFACIDRLADTLIDRGIAEDDATGMADDYVAEHLDSYSHNLDEIAETFLDEYRLLQRQAEHGIDNDLMAMVRGDAS